tara:strand:- start:36916 stop:37326 length:411 start_codon:yes stop_codon:yes gene_type:complete
MMDKVRQRGGGWSARQEVDADPATVAEAWSKSEDPFSMLLLLAVFHPGVHEMVCNSLVARMSPLSPIMRREQEIQSRARRGMDYNGPCRFRFLHVAQRIRGAIDHVSEDKKSALALALSTTIREVVGAPYTLPNAD